MQTKIKKRFLTVILLLIVLPLAACGGGAEEVVPTAVPTSEPTAPTPEPVKPTPEPAAEPTTAPEPTPSPLTTADLQAATVQIYAKFDVRGRLQTSWTGSGTIISADGLILTNAHVVSPLAPGLAAQYNDPQFLFGDEPEQLVVGIVESADLPPVETYRAEVRAADGTLDLAVIQITETMDGAPFDPGAAALPFVPMGDAEALNLGDEIQILGFPGAGGETITFTRGDVSGFEIQDRVGPRAWIKTDTTFSPGNSGGLGANAQGEIVGVPSYVLEAVGGSINRLRSVNYALPLIEAAQSSQPYESPYVTAGSGKETLELVTFSEDFDEETKCALGPLDSYPTGSPAVVAVFSYKGMVDGEQFIAAWFYEDEFLTSEIITWEFGESGDCFAVYVHNFGDPLEDGRYDVELYAGFEMDLVGFAGTTVGGKSVATSSSGDAVQVNGRVVDADSGKPIAEAAVIILNPGADLDAFIDEPTEADIYAFVETDKRGEFDLGVPFERGVEYPGIVAKSGYRPNDGFLLFDESDPDVITLELTLSQ